MSVRNGLALFTLLSIVLLAPGIVSAQSATSDAGQTMRTPDGQPDISGIFTFRTLTPLERPTRLGDQVFFTEEEVDDLEHSLKHQSGFV